MIWAKRIYWFLCVATGCFLGFALPEFWQFIVALLLIFGLVFFTAIIEAGRFIPHMASLQQAGYELVEETRRKIKALEDERDEILDKLKAAIK